MEFRKNTVVFGILLGLLIPFVTYAILLMFNDSVDWGTLFGNPRFEKFSTKLLAIIAICGNTIPFQYFHKYRMDNGLRGVVFPTVVYAMFWLSYFSGALFGG